MALTLAQISTSILGLVNKTNTYQGFYTTQKVTDAVNDSLDYIAAEMFQRGNGWFNTITTLNVTAGTPTVALPTSCSIIQAVRYLVGNVYVALMYDDQATQTQVQDPSATVQYPASYRLVNDAVLGPCIYFNPVPGASGTGYVQLEYSAYPTLLANSGDTIDPQFDRCLTNYVKWRAASQLVAQVGNPMPAWQRYEDEWLAKMKETVSRRIRQTQWVKDFEF